MSEALDAARHHLAESDRLLGSPTLTSGLAPRELCSAVRALIQVVEEQQQLINELAAGGDAARLRMVMRAAGHMLSQAVDK